MFKTFTLAAAAALLLAGCSKPEADDRYNVELPMNELMGHVIDPAAFAFWRASGSEITEEGTKSLTPTTEEGWEIAENGAATVAEAGNLLMLPGRAREEEEWFRLAKAMTDAALQARAAAMAKDEAKMFETGGKLYETCVACHEKYVAPFLDADGNMKK